MRPTPFAVGIAAGLVPAALLPAVLGPSWVVVVAAALALLVVAGALDALAGPFARHVAVEVTAPDTLFVGETGELVARVSVPTAAFPTRVAVLADLGDELAPVEAVRVSAPARGAATARLPLSTRRRGAPRVATVWLRWTGPLGLVERRRRQAVGRSVAVVPDIRPVRAAAMRLLARRDAVPGAHRSPFVGSGSEFESLRDWVPGLDPRTISWRASARHRTLLSIDMRAERDRPVVVAIDTGRSMGEAVAGVPRLDHAIHASLLLSYVALRTGDRVGLFAFDDRVRAWAEPEGGMDAFPRLRASTAALAYSTAETGYTLGLAELSVRLRRRSLIVLLTEVADSITAELMLENVGRLARRHVVLFLEIEDPELSALALAPPTGTRELERAVVASDILRERDLVRRRLRRLGVHVAGAPPAESGPVLVRRYLDAHRRELVG